MTDSDGGAHARHLVGKLGARMLQCAFLGVEALLGAKQSCFQRANAIVGDGEILVRISLGEFQMEQLEMQSS